MILGVPLHVPALGRPLSGQQGCNSFEGYCWISSNVPLGFVMQLQSLLYWRVHAGFAAGFLLSRSMRCDIDYGHALP
jgi:hypothetical protein